MAEATIAKAMLTGAMSGGTESVEFLNEIMAALQPYLRVAVSKMVKEMVEPMFKDTLPGPLKSLHFTKVDLGATPMRFSAVDVHKVVGDSLKFDMNVDWDGDMDVELDADLIPGFGVQHVKFSGRLSVLLRPLLDTMPLIGAMQVSLINPPDMELDFTGAANALDIGLIDDKIRKIISDIVASILVLPNRLLVKLDPVNDLYKSYLDPIGFARVKVESAAGLQTTGRIVKDVPDPYCVVSFGGNQPWETKTINNTETPVWNEKHDFLLSDREQRIIVELRDSDALGQYDRVGTAMVSVGSVYGAEGHKLVVPLAPGKANPDATSATVTLSCEVFDLVPEMDSVLAPGTADDENLNNGVLTILLAGAKGLKGAREELKTQVVVECNEQTFLSPIVMDFPGIDVSNPCYDSVYRIMLTPEIVAAAPEIKFTLKKMDKPIGEYKVAFADLLSAPGNSITSEFLVEVGGTLFAKSYLMGIRKQE